MPPDTNPTPPDQPDTSDDSESLSEVWLDLDWSPWVPFDAPREFFYIPKEPGIFRIRPAGKDFLMYIGETGQSLHKKLAELRQTLRRDDLMPWSDPHEAAPCLFAWREEWTEELLEKKRWNEPGNSGKVVSPDNKKNPNNDQGSENLPTEDQECPEITSGDREEPEQEETFTYECSAAPLDATGSGRKGMVALLLCHYRQDHDESPLCNFGRFHPRYRKSTSRAQGKRGAKLEDNQQDNPAGFPSIEPLEPTGKPGDRDWMGLEWTAWQDLTRDNVKGTANGAGLYQLADAGNREIIYIGQSADLQKRLLEHTSKAWDDKAQVFSYQIIGQSVLPHNLEELKTDLIGNFYEQNKKAPEFQFRGTKRHET